MGVSGEPGQEQTQTEPKLPVIEQTSQEQVASKTSAVTAGSQTSTPPTVIEPLLLTEIEPQYPPLALSARVEGEVEFTVTIGSDGRVEQIELVRRHPLLVDAAPSAVKNWVYQPVVVNGRPTTVKTDVSVPFHPPEP